MGGAYIIFQSVCWNRNCFIPDFKEFNTPFLNPVISSLLVPSLSLVLPAIIFTIVFIFLNLMNKKASSLFLILIISICIVLYIFRAYYLINTKYLDLIVLITFFIASVLIIVLKLNYYVFSFFQILPLIAVSMTIYFCYEYYNFLVSNRLVTAVESSEENNEYKLGNTDTPVFIIIFDELSSYLVLDVKGDINGDLFPELKEFSKTSTWYANATTQTSDTVSSLSSLFSGYDYLKKCENQSGLCKHNVIRELVLGKSSRKNFLNLSGINPRVNTMDRWYPIGMDEDKDEISIISKNKKQYRPLKKSLHIYIKSLLDIYMMSIVNPNWSSKIQGIDTFLDLTDSKHAKGAILEGMPEYYDFLACATKTAKSVERFNLFINRIDTEIYSINSILTNLTHAPFCYDEDGMVEVVYPIRKVSDSSGNGKDNYVPDAVSMIDLTQSSCTNDEISYNVRRSRINQSKLAMKLFNKALRKIKDKGIFDKSLIVVMSDHGVGFLGPSFGRGNHMLRKKEDILDNRMMNASILLMIKYPNQRQASVDYKMVRHIDVGATVIDILEFRPLWNIDGQSLVSDDWNEVLPPLDFYQMLFKDNSYKTSSKGLWVEGDIIQPTVYFEVFKEKLEKISVTKSKWIGSEADKLALSDKKAGKLEYLKIEKALPSEKNGEFVLTLGGFSFDLNLNPSTQTYIAVNNMIIK